MHCNNPLLAIIQVETAFSFSQSVIMNDRSFSFMQEISRRNWSAGWQLSPIASIYKIKCACQESVKCFHRKGVTHWIGDEVAIKSFPSFFLCLLLGKALLLCSLCKITWRQDRNIRASTQETFHLFHKIQQFCAQGKNEKMKEWKDIRYWVDVIIVGFNMVFLENFLWRDL